MSMKGFTLIELLAVLALLAVVAVIAVTNGMSILNSSKSSLSDTQEDTIIDAAKNYQATEGIENGYISVDDLATKGYLDSSELTDPKTKDEMKGGVCIKHITEEEGQKVDKYNFKYAEKEADC